MFRSGSSSIPEHRSIVSGGRFCTDYFRPPSVEKPIKFRWLARQPSSLHRTHGLTVGEVQIPVPVPQTVAGTVMGTAVTHRIQRDYLRLGDNTTRNLRNALRALSTESTLLPSEIIACRISYLYILSEDLRAGSKSLRA